MLTQPYVSQRRHTLSGTEAGAAVNNMTGGEPSAFEFLNLTKTQRMYAFGACLVIGFALSLLGAILFTLGQVALFATFYVIGVIVSLVGSESCALRVRRLSWRWLTCPVLPCSWIPSGLRAAGEEHVGPRAAVRSRHIPAVHRVDDGVRVRDRD